MTVVRTVLVNLWIVATACASSIGHTSCSLPARVAEVQDLHGRYEVPSTEELQHSERLFTALLKAETLHEPLGPWRIDTVVLAGRLYHFVAEAPSERCGRGCFLIAADARGPICLQAPHSFYDRGTGGIVAHMAGEGRFRAAAWNTVPRWSADGDYQGRADSQHEGDNHFVAFARAYARVVVDGAIVQLHGFAAEKRTTLAGATAGAIVSGGTRVVPSQVWILTAALKLRFPRPVRLYPREVDELGARSNTTAATLRRCGAGTFIHIELSALLRRDLAEDVRVRRSFAECLQKYLD